VIEKMSDDNVQVPAPVESTGIAATAVVAANVNALTEDVAKLRKQIKSVWVAVIVLIVLVVALAASTLAPRLLGVRGMGGAGFQGRQGGFQPGQGTSPQGPGGAGAPQAPGGDDQP
jgi:hypothetical protein